MVLSKTGLLDTRNGETSYVVSLLLYCLFVVAGEACLLASICYHYNSGWLTLETAFAAVFLVFAAALFFSLWGRASKEEHTLFVLVAIPLLAGFAFFMMPFAVPDEFTHINRIFDNRSSMPYLTVPLQMRDAYDWIGNYDILGTLLNLDFDYSLTKETEYVAAKYYEINYVLPSLVAMGGKILGINGYAVVFAARMVNAALYLVACYWMLKKLPVGKKLAFVFFLNPMLLQQEASCSADALCNIAVLGFIVQTMAMRYDARPSLPKREWLILGCFAVLVAVCKYAYLPLAIAAVILLPKIERRIIRRSVPIAMAFFSVAAVAFLVLRGYGSIIENSIHGFQPDAFFGVLFATITQEGPTLLWQLAGGNLGWPYMNYNSTINTVHIPYCWIVYLVLLLTAVLASFDVRAKLKGWERAGMIALGIVEAFLLYIALWEGFPGPGPITWLQGRYFIPPLFLMLSALVFSKKTPFTTISIKVFAVALIVVNAASLLFVIEWFW